MSEPFHGNNIDETCLVACLRNETLSFYTSMSSDIAQSIIKATGFRLDSTQFMTTGKATLHYEYRNHAITINVSRISFDLHFEIIPC